MSHCCGVLCIVCECVLVPDDRCPEGCTVGHGWTYQVRCDWARKTWPDHACFADCSMPSSSDGC